VGESKAGVLRLVFDRRLKLEFHGSQVTSDAGLLPCQEACSRKSWAWLMIYDEDPFRRRPRKSTARRKRQERCV